MAGNKRNGKLQMTIGVDHRKQKPEPRIQAALKAIRDFFMKKNPEWEKGKH